MTTLPLWVAINMVAMIFFTFPSVNEVTTCKTEQMYMARKLYFLSYIALYFIHNLTNKNTRNSHFLSNWGHFIVIFSILLYSMCWIKAHFSYHPEMHLFNDCIWIYELKWFVKWQVSKMIDLSILYLGSTLLRGG